MDYHKTRVSRIPGNRDQGTPGMVGTRLHLLSGCTRVLLFRISAEVADFGGFVTCKIMEAHDAEFTCLFCGLVVLSGGWVVFSGGLAVFDGGFVASSRRLVVFSGILVVISGLLVVCSGRPFCFKRLP